MATTEITALMSASVDPASVTGNTVRIFGSQTGRHSGRLVGLGSTIRFVSDRPFAEGEVVSVVLTTGIRSAAGASLPAPRIWQFLIRPEFGNGILNVPPFVIPLSAGSGPTFLWAGNLTNDSYPDLVVVNGGSRSISILRNPALAGAGKIAASAVSVPILNGANQVSGGDLDGDGRMDLVVTNLLDNTLTLLFNEGDASFRSVDLPTAERPYASVTGDLDGDGWLDIAVASFGADHVEIHRNQGNGTFDAPVILPTPKAPIAVEAVDIDNDGDLDLVVLCSGARLVQIFLNAGNGTFPDDTTVPLDFTPSSFVVRDMVAAFIGPTGDGWVDIAVAAADTNLVTVYVNRGESGVPVFSSRTAPLPSGRALAIAVADLDTADVALAAGLEDADLDLLTTHFAGGALEVRTNVGAASLPGQTQDVYPAGLTPLGIVTADFDRDGDIDVAVTNLALDEIRLFMNGGGRFGCLQIDRSQLDFGDVYTCRTLQRNLVFTNVCPEPIMVESVLSSSDIFQATLQPATVPPGDTITVPIVFAPTQQRPYAYDLVLQTDDGTVKAANRYQLTGRGIRSILLISPTSVDFGAVVIPGTYERQVAVQNNGNFPATIRSAVSSDPVFRLLDDLPKVIMPSTSNLVRVQFEPTARADYNAVITLETDDVCEPNHPITLRGRAAPPLPDLVALGIDGSTEGLILRNSSRFTGRVANRDSLIDRPFRLSMRLNGVEVADTTVFRMAVDQTLLFPATILLSKPGMNRIEFIADPDDQIDEADETNNTTALDVTVNEGTQVLVSPNPFTPNGDGFNDRVKFDFKEMVLSEPMVKILSFEGSLVRQLDATGQLQVAWDGLDERGAEMRPGVYLYLVTDGSKAIGSGHITLAR